MRKTFFGKRHMKLGHIDWGSASGAGLNRPNAYPAKRYALLLHRCLPFFVATGCRTEVCHGLFLFDLDGWNRPEVVDLLE